MDWSSIDSCLNQSLLWWLQHGDFQLQSSLHIWILWVSKSSLFSPIHPSIHPRLLPVWTHGFFLNSIFWTRFFSSMLIKLNYTQFCSNCSRFGQWKLLQADVFFWYTPTIGGTSLLWDITRCPRLILYLTCSRSVNSHFSEEKFYFYGGMEGYGIRKPRSGL